jgi:hypothetical protein
VLGMAVLWDAGAGKHSPGIMNQEC